MLLTLTRLNVSLRVVANELCEQVILGLLDVLHPILPRDDLPLFTHLLARDQYKLLAIGARNDRAY